MGARECIGFIEAPEVGPPSSASSPIVPPTAIAAASPTARVSVARLDPVLRPCGCEEQVGVRGPHALFSLQERPREEPGRRFRFRQHER